jgi:hypothetical protein
VKDFPKCERISKVHPYTLLLNWVLVFPIRIILYRCWSDQILKEAFNRVFNAQLSANAAHFGRVLIGSKVAVGSRDSSVGIATSYRLDGRCSIPGKGKKIFSTSQRPDRLWGPSNLLMGTGAPRPWYSDRSVKLTTHLHLVTRSRMVELYLRSLTHIHGVLA